MGAGERVFSAGTEMSATRSRAALRAGGPLSAPPAAGLGFAAGSDGSALVAGASSVPAGFGATLDVASSTAAGSATGGDAAAFAPFVVLALEVACAASDISAQTTVRGLPARFVGNAPPEFVGP